MHPTSVRSLRPKSWLQLQDMLFADTWNPNIQRFRSDFAYRGVGNSEFALKSSLSRLGENFREFEAHLLRNFKKYASRTSQQYQSSEWNWLALAEHHGLPTRMLDWAYSRLRSATPHRANTLFSFLSNPQADFERWLHRHFSAMVAKRIVIPAALKWEIRDKLDQANITERVLFPGLDGLSRWLKGHYFPRPAV